MNELSWLSLWNYIDYINVCDYNEIIKAHALEEYKEGTWIKIGVEPQREGCKFSTPTQNSQKIN